MSANVASRFVRVDDIRTHYLEAGTGDCGVSRPAFGELARADVYSIGRYGGWTYCSIEDNIVEARALAQQFGD